MKIVRDQYGAKRAAPPDGMADGSRLLTTGEVGQLFRVDPKTVNRWAVQGRLGSIRTPGGHHRFRESEVNDLLTGSIEKAVGSTG